MTILLFHLMHANLKTIAKSSENVRKFECCPAHEPADSFYNSYQNIMRQNQERVRDAFILFLFSIF